MSSTKSAIGHLLGAAGAVEAIFSTLAIKTGIVPPTLNLENPSEATEGMDLVPLKAKQREVRAALSNSFGFGGTNARSEEHTSELQSLMRKSYDVFRLKEKHIPHTARTKKDVKHRNDIN